MNNDDILSIPRLIASLKREIILIAVSTAALFLLALLYVFMATPLYTAQTSILLDPAKAESVSEMSSKAIGRFEGPAITSKIEVIKSRRVALKAHAIIAGSAGTQVVVSNDNVIDEGALSAFRSGLHVFREGESYVLTIRYVSDNPEKSASYANAYALAYVNDQLNSFSEDASKAEGWLQAKIETLREQSVAANLALQAFRKKNNIIQSESGSVNDQQLANINDRLSDATANTAQARVRYLHARNIVEKRNITAAVAQAFDNDVINNIRTEYLADKQRLLKWRRTLGNDHQTVIALDSKLVESRNIIFSEMKRIAQSFKTEFEVALAQENAMKSNLDGLIGTKIDNDGQSFELGALEKEAESYATLYDEYLNKYAVMQQQQSFPVAESSIISKAVPPSGKSHPKSILVLGMGLILGAGLGCLAALIKDNMDNSFKRAGQVKTATGLHFLGFLPAAKYRLGASNASSFGDANYAQSVDEPDSLHAETCQNIDVTIHRKSEAKCNVVGVSADNAHDGKSITSGNLALYLAQSGHKTLLIDADVRKPDLTQENLGQVNNGLNAVLANKAKLEESIIRDTKTNLHVLPTESSFGAGKANLVHTKAMREMISKAKEDFDYIIVNLPAMSSTSDASSSTPYVDFFLFVLEWAKSKPNEFNFMLKTNEIPKDKVLGVVLGQADMKKMAKNYGHRTNS